MMDPIPEHYPLLSNGERGQHFMPSPDFVLNRLDQIDSRLRQLEERQKQSREKPQEENYFTADMKRMVVANSQSIHRPCGSSSSSLSTAVKEVQVRGTLMDRLRLLESRILQLGYDLEKRCKLTATSAMTRAEREETNKHVPPSSDSDPLLMAAQKLLEGARRLTANDIFQTQKRKVKKNKKPKDVFDALDKNMNIISKEEKRKLARARLYKRWFAVGC